MNLASREPRPEDLAFSRILAYCKYQYKPFEISKFHVLIAQHLQDIERGKIDRLMISLPPRSGKTFLIKYFIAWFMGRNPTSEVIYTSYNSQRASDVGRDCRNIMASDNHNHIFPNGRLSYDAKASTKFSTEAGGTFFATGWGSSITGRGANIFIVDDLIRDRIDDRSELSSKDRKEWFSSTAYTRLMPKDLSKGRISAIIAIGTRWSYNDFMSYLENDLSHENWINLKLPAICEDMDTNERGVDILGRKPGEVLWKEKFDLERLERTKRTLTPLDWSALYQQRPLPTTGGMINLSDIQRFDLSKIHQQRDIMQNGGTVPENMQYIKNITISIDSASKTNAVHDNTAITVWGSDKDNANHYLIGCINVKVEFPELLNLIIKTYEQYQSWRIGTPLVICEDRSSGIALIQHLKKTSKIPIIAVNPCKSKDLRMEDALVHVAAGRIFFPQTASWLYEVELQCAQFPLGRYRDIPDSISQFINHKFARKIRKRTKYKGYIR